MRTFWPVLASACLLLGSTAQARDAWQEVESRHFRVISDGTPGQARRIALQFEQIRAAFQKALPDLSQDPGQPVLVIAVKDEDGFKALLPQYWEGRNRAQPSGVFLKGPERHYVVLRLDRAGSTRFRTVYHEYFHVLASLNFPRIPLWLNEGLAEFYSRTNFTGQHVELGLPIAEHVALLRSRPWLSLSVLFDVDEDSAAYNSSHQASIFYSQSWALVHYLTLRDSRKGEKPLTKLLEDLGKGVDYRPALRRALGDFAVLEANLERYVEGNEFSFYRYSKPSLAGVSPLRPRTLGESESAAWQALFLVRNDRPVEARRLIDRALILDDSVPVAHEAMGHLHYSQGRPSEALESFHKAVELGSRSYLAHYYYGFLGHQTQSVSEQGIEASLRHAIDLRPRFAYSYTALATFYLNQVERGQEALVLARRAAKLEPGNPAILQTLAYALAVEQDFDGAADVVDEIRRHSRSSQDREILRRLDDYLRRHRGFEEEGRAPVGSGTTGDVSGTIISVTCQAPATLNLVMRTQEGFRNFVSYDANSLEYLTATQDLPRGQFNPCDDLEGRSARIRFEVDSATSRERPVSIILGELRH